MHFGFSKADKNKITLIFFKKHMLKDDHEMTINTINLLFRCNGSLLYFAWAVAASKYSTAPVARNERIKIAKQDYWSLF